MNSTPESGEAQGDATPADGELTEPSTEIEPPTPDDELLAAHDLARAALVEITPESTIGEPAGYTLEPGGVVSLRFANRLAGYPGWFWTVSVARVAGAEPTVLEAELLPGEAALLAPEWVPWAVRLADYQAAQAALAEAGESEEDDDEDADLDDGASLLHAGDVDGVDIDELDDDESDEDEPDEDDELDDDADDLDDESDEDPDLADDDDLDADDFDDDDLDPDDEAERTY